MSYHKSLASSFLVTVLTLAVSNFASAADKPESQEVKVVNKANRTEVQFTQQAERLEARNRVTIKLNVEARGNNAQQIQRDINKRMTAAISKAQEIPAISVETGSYSVSRPYDSENAKENDRWRGSQTLSLTSDDFDAVIKLSGELQGDGLVMDEMRFFVAPETLKAAQDELTSVALQTLKDRTNHVADDLGLKIERYKSITIGNASEEYGESNRKAGKAVSVASGKNAPPAVAAGYALVTLQVSATAVMSERQ